MHMASLDALPYTRHASRDAALFESGRSLASDSDAAGLFDVDSVTDRAQLHRLFEGAVVVAEVDDCIDYPTIGFER